MLKHGQDLYARSQSELLREYLAGAAEWRILHVGCGCGELSLELAALGHTLHGIDPDPQAINQARIRARDYPDLACSFAVGTLDSFRASADFDCVVASDVLAQAEDDRAAFSRLVSLVKPGGTVLLTVPAGPWLLGSHDEQRGHRRRYSRESLRSLVRGQIDIQSMRYFGFTLIPRALVLSRWLRRPDTTTWPQGALAIRLLQTLTWADRWMPAPLGTTLLLKGVRKSAAELPVRLAA